MMVCQGPQHDAVKEESAMIGKILLTLAVIAVAYLMVRRDSGSKPDTAKSAPAKSVADDQKNHLTPRYTTICEPHPICFCFSW